MGVSRPLHLQKLCVGAETVEDLADWRREYAEARRAQGLDPTLRHVTRSWPKRAAEILDGGSLYWVFRGLILARQRILALEPVDEGDGVIRCGIVLGDEIVRTRPAPRRPFQGWRYLEAADAPPDLRDAGREFSSGSERESPRLEEGGPSWIGATAEDWPRGSAAEGDLPPELQTALSEIGVVRRRA